MTPDTVLPTRRDFQAIQKGRAILFVIHDYTLERFPRVNARPHATTRRQGRLGSRQKCASPPKANLN